MKKFNKAIKMRQTDETDFENVNKANKIKKGPRSYKDEIDADKWSKKKFLDVYYEEE